MSQIIPVWVINLQRRPDRLSKIGKQLDDMGIVWSKIDAVDGKTCNDNYLNKSAKKGKIGELSKGARGCIASHFIFWEKLIQSNSDYGVVLEDDIELSPDFKDILSDESWIPENTLIIKLEKLIPYRPSKLLLGRAISSINNNERHIHKMYSRHCGSGAYLMSKSGANTVLSWNKVFSVPVDHLLFNETVSKLSSALNPLIMVPPLAWQAFENGFDSDIDNHLPLPKLKKFFRSLKRAYFETRLLPYQIFVLCSGLAKIVVVNKK